MGNHIMGSNKVADQVERLIVTNASNVVAEDVTTTLAKSAVADVDKRLDEGVDARQADIDHTDNISVGDHSVIANTDAYGTHNPNISSCSMVDNSTVAAITASINTTEVGK
uniref:Uncharacterized protein n=1 Tax=Lygus hesperus TaxID=30085 RepID=A0A146M6N6_LYGHE